MTTITMHPCPKHNQKKKKQTQNVKKELSENSFDGMFICENLTQDILFSCAIHGWICHIAFMIDTVNKKSLLLDRFLRQSYAVNVSLNFQVPIPPATSMPLMIHSLQKGQLRTMKPVSENLWRTMW